MNTTKKWALALLSALCFSNYSNAQDVTGNLISPYDWTGQSITGSWSGANPRDHVFGCCEGGPGAAVDTTGTGYIWFAWGMATVSQGININSALSGSGIKVSGFNYSYDYYNYGYNRGTLTTYINVTSKNGQELHGYYWNHAPTAVDGWHTNSGTKTFDSPYSLANLGSITMMFTGKDDRFWAGYYGPSVSNASISLNYTADQCATNPLSSPSCSGFAAALSSRTAAPAEPVAAVITPAPVTTVTAATAPTESVTAATTTRSVSAVRAQAVAAAVNQATAATVAATVQQSQQTSQPPDAQQTTAEATGTTFSTGRSATDTAGDSPTAGFTRPGDPAAAARGLASQPREETVAETRTQPRAVQPPAELAGGPSITAFQRGVDITAYTTLALRDGALYAPREIYRNQQPVDNVRALRGLGSDRRHAEMIDQQYRR